MDFPRFLSQAPEAPAAPPAPARAAAPAPPAAPAGTFTDVPISNVRKVTTTGPQRVQTRDRSLSDYFQSDPVWCSSLSGPELLVKWRSIKLWLPVWVCLGRPSRFLGRL